MAAFKEFAEDIHKNAKSKGWWDRIDPEDPYIVLSKLALVHSEVSEAAEEVRRASSEELRQIRYTEGKPDGFPIELADAVIRIFDLAEAVGCDIEEALMTKHRYNAIRSYRHGGKKA